MKEVGSSQDVQEMSTNRAGVLDQDLGRAPTATAGSLIAREEPSASEHSNVC